MDTPTIQTNPESQKTMAATSQPVLVFFSSPMGHPLFVAASHRTQSKPAWPVKRLGGRHVSFVFSQDRPVLPGFQRRIVRNLMTRQGTRTFVSQDQARLAGTILARTRGILAQRLGEGEFSWLGKCVFWGSCVLQLLVVAVLSRSRTNTCSVAWNKIRKGSARRKGLAWNACYAKPVVDPASARMDCGRSWDMAKTQAPNAPRKLPPRTAPAWPGVPTRSSATGKTLAPCNKPHPPAARRATGRCIATIAPEIPSLEGPGRFPPCAW